jgi:two-component system OmpR family response regulator
MRVLVVEDEAVLARQLAGALDQAGYAVDCAADGERADFMVQTEQYDAVVLDLGLPKIDGLTLLKRWREQGVATPVLVLTARGSWHEKVQGIDGGADDYVAKPFQMEELLARLRAIRRATGQVQPSCVAARWRSTKLAR